MEGLWRGWRFAMIGMKKLQDISDEGCALSCNRNAHVLLTLKIFGWFCYSRCHTVQFVYVIVWLTVVFGINSASNVGRKIVIVQGTAEHYYNFHTCIASTINSKYYSQPYCYRLIQYCCRR